jgi:hypothetical protein
MPQQYDIASYLRTGTVLRHKLAASTYHYSIFVDEKIGTMGFRQGSFRAHSFKRQRLGNCN